MDWSTACPDWPKRILARQSLIPFDPLFPDEAAAALDVFRDLLIVDAPGSPRMGDACREWVFDFVGTVFGSYDAETGRRLIRDYLLLVSKKNSKSTLAAGIMLTALIRNWRMSAEFLILAPTIEVANNSFGPAADMVLQDEDLSALLKVNRPTRTITHRTTGATLKVVAADNDTVSGKKAAGVLVDELWLFGKRANAENMLLEATGGLASRPEGFVIYLTTQSDEPPAGVFAQKLKYFRDVRDGEVADPRSLGVLYEFPPDLVKAKGYLDPGLFYVTNPNLGLSVDEQFILDLHQKALRAGPASLAGFLAKHLNVEIGLALRSDRWAGADYWERRADRALTLPELLLRCEVVTVGIDGGGLDDLLGLAVLGREIGARRWLLWTKAWVHEGVLTLRQSEASRVQDLAATGDLVLVDDLVVANQHLAELVMEVDASGLLSQVGLDMYGTTDAKDALALAGMDVETRVVGIPQGWQLNGTIKAVETRLASGTLMHAGQPLMNWCVGNAKVVPVGNAISITKASSGTGKIDPLVAAFCAGALMVKNPAAQGRATAANTFGGFY